MPLVDFSNFSITKENKSLHEEVVAWIVAVTSIFGTAALIENGFQHTLYSALDSAKNKLGSCFSWCSWFRNNSNDAAKTPRTNDNPLEDLRIETQALKQSLSKLTDEDKHVIETFYDALENPSTSENSKAPEVAPVTVQIGDEEYYDVNGEPLDTPPGISLKGK